MTTALRMTARDVLARLERHYVKPGELMPGGVFLPEVTYGRQGGTRADALYVGFTTSRGRYLIGHEIKVARSDWLHELDQPDKADAWASECHAWYVVAPSTDIVNPEELPAGWGLLTCEGQSKTRLKTVRGARDYPDRQPSWAAALSVISRQDTLRATAINDARMKAREEAEREIDARVETQIGIRMSRVPDAVVLQKRLRHYEEVLGIRVSDELERFFFRDGEVPLDEVQLVGDLLRRHRSIRNAVDEMLGRYAAGHLDAVGRQLAALADAVEGLRTLGAAEAIA